jgi:predicted Ser/Thr protein kinase
MKTIVIEATPCPGCGKPMPAGVLAGLCPACLLAQGVGTDAGDARKGVRFEPPSVAEVAKLFPQLEILGLLGAGGMGAVYKARQPVLDRMVALKVLPASGAEGVNFEERFNREARALARLSHPNIVAVHEFGKADSLHFFIMEFVDGANLRQLEQAGRLAPREALQIIPQICDALQYAHDEGVVHRDIKPENVLIDRKGRVKIADFGLAKILGVDADSLRLTAEGQVMGTPHYMAPEQVERPLSVDHRADIYSLGVVFYEMLTGDLPLGKFSPPSQKYQLDVRLDEVVLRALENDPARRYQQASEVKTRVETISGTPAPAAAAVSATEQHFIRCAGFPVVAEREGMRKVNRKGALQMFGILFGVLTVAFGIISLVTGRTWFGWLGISGALSLQLRLLIAALVTAWGVWHALRSKPAVESLPKTPQGTVILPPERFSRKAIIGVCWMPCVLFVLFMYHAVPGAAGRAHDGPSWWEIALGVIMLLLGFSAPFGTTILGWLAVSDIRRMNGCLSGLPLAVFDGLIFPLLAFDVFLGRGLHHAFYWFTATQMERSFQNPPRELVTFGVVLICAVMDLVIIRRVWHSVRLGHNTTPARRDWWWSRKPGAVAIGVACALVILAVAQRRETRINPIHARVQLASLNPLTGTQGAKLPERGEVELRGVRDAGAAANEWWRPDGRAIPDQLYELGSISSLDLPGWTNKELVLHFDLPPGAGGPYFQFEPLGGYSMGSEVWRDGKRSLNSWSVQAAFPKLAREGTMRIGFDLGPWQTVSVHDRNGNGHGLSTPGIPNMQAEVHEVGEHNGQARVTMLMAKENPDWKTRVIAVDRKDTEHSDYLGRTTPAGNSRTLTHEFLRLPLDDVKEFRVQVRPVHWVEFQKVKLVPDDRNAIGKSARPFKAMAFSDVKEVRITSGFDFDAGVPVEALLEFTIETQRGFLDEFGVDAVARGKELELIEMGIADLAPSEWERQPPETLAERLNRSLYAPPRLPSSKNPLPLTYAFRTRTGTLGMMQLVGFPEGQSGVVVRYKVVERAHFE